jgi:acetyl-CoA carboxylase biotin carboxyl carrier protein
VTQDNHDVLGDIDLKHIIGLIEALDRSHFDSLQLDVGRFRLTLGRGQNPPQPHATGQEFHVEPIEPVPSPQTASKPIRTDEELSVAIEKPKTSSQNDLVDVHSPIMGLFYSKPDPASPPFVSLGTEVDEGTTVGLIEVMKVFNAIQAGTKGTIVEICVEDAQTVEIGETLFRIKPAARDAL